jgi:O-antigen/teichoic acid export membrane protein
MPALSQLRSLLRTGASIAVAMGIMNVATYASTLLAARLLGPREYGGYAAVTGLLLVIGVLMLGLQTTGARRIAEAPTDVGQIERSLLRVSYRAAWVLALLTLLLTPVIDVALNLRSTATAVIIALTVWPMTAVGGQSGVLQGERRWLPLSGVYLSMGLARFAAVLLLFVWPTESVATLSMAIGFAAPTLLAWWVLRADASRRTARSDGHGQRQVLREVASNSHALLAFFALSNADVILSRTVLDAHASGLYAGGLIVVKSLLFLPQFVVVVAFPSMATTEARRATLLRSVAIVVALGVLAVTAIWALSDLALVFVGGADYAAVRDQLWVFAVLGTVLSVIQLLVYGVVARQSRRAVYLIWVALAVLVAAASRADSVTSMLLTVTVVDAVLMVLLLAVSLWRMATPASVGSVVPAVAGADRDVEGHGQLRR